MGCFTGEVEEVKNTCIFAQLGAQGNQIISRMQRHLYRQSMHGAFDNGDVVVKMSAA